MGVHGEGVHAANIGVRYVAYFQAIFPMSFHHTQIKVKPPLAGRAVALCVPRVAQQPAQVARSVRAGRACVTELAAYVS